MTNDATTIRTTVSADALQKASDAICRAMWRLDAIAQLLVLAWDSAARMNDGRKNLDSCGLSEVGEMLCEVGQALDVPCDVLLRLAHDAENGGDEA